MSIKEDDKIPPENQETSITQQINSIQALNSNLPTKNAIYLSNPHINQIP